ncbi:hypothetical protein E3Q17_02240 [Wallemia mellicola]|uniref:Uncharacterized protein n=1 Tax=Wallemia mellicola TaxID=1708541 RepID=A0A4T0NSD0_9BASI|nr:hypothetical protein E3Q17_02240 [Wallemia mellicola]
MITKTVNYKKLPPKEEKSKEVRIPKLYKRLYSQITNGYYKNALQTTSKLLNLEGNNDELIKTKLFLLLQLDSYNQALSLTENSSFDFEEAYTNYRLKKNTSTSSGNDRKWSILQAQLAYRQADYQSAINLYQSLLSDLDPNDDEYHDIETNLKAAKESLDFHSHGYLTAIEELNVPPLDVLENALRHDFLLPQNPSNPLYNEHYHNTLTLPSKLTRESPDNSLLYHTYVDPPTTTLQRIKGLTTGSLPTFIDIGNAFSGTSIEEDSLIRQLKNAHKKTAFVGDDTWMSVFPDSFDEQFPYDSFNVEDLHSVDNGVTKHIFPLIANNTDFIIGHFLGVDHVGHRVGPSHETMSSKLKQMNDVLTRVVEVIDDDTLLVVMGDHGMDSRGDHGGDSELETSAALWMYSKQKPLTNSKARTFANSLPHHQGHRTIQQIDILPSLSLLLGLAIPFNNLGGIIPELFPIPSVLRQAQDVTSNQIWKYLKSYAKGQSGHEIKPFLQSLQQKLNLAKEAKSLEEGSYFNKDHISYYLYSDFFNSTLQSCRSIWAQFDALLMLSGGLLLLMSLPILVGVFNRAGRNSSCDWMKVAVRDAQKAAPWALVVASFFSIALLKGKHIESIIFIICFAVELALSYAVPPLSIPKALDLFGILSHLAIFLSNSYVLWEDRVLLVILQTPILFSLVRAPYANQARMKKQLAIASASIAFTLRLMAGSTVCREELGGWCAVTFYETSSSSLSPAWVYATLIPSAIATYFVLRYSLNVSASFAGFAGIFVGGFTLSLVLGSSYWLLDLLEMKTPSYVLITIKTTLARTNILFAGVVGYTFWYVSTLCIDIKEENRQDGKREVKVLGFSNSYGAYYLLFMLPAFALMWLTNLPTGQLALFGCLIVILVFLELTDYQNDEKALDKLLKRPSKYTKKDGKMVAPPQPRPALWRSAWLAQLGYLLYYSTGHQAVLSTLQWKAAFIGFPKLTYPYAPLLVSINTLSGFILVSLAVPLLVYWKVAPKVNASQSLNTNILRAGSGFVLYNTLITLATLIAAAHFRRHLMVWKVFAPRFMLGGLALLATDATLLAAISLGASITSTKVSRVFKTTAT